MTQSADADPQIITLEVARVAQDLDNLQMIPGVENLNKQASFNTAK